MMACDSEAMRKRATRRYRCKDSAIAYLTATGTEARYEIKLLDISEEGIGFLLSRTLDYGTEIAITLASLKMGHITLVGRIAHVTECGNSLWAIGCSLKRRIPAVVMDELL